MKLTIGSKLIALPVDTKISIERSSPLLNDDTGSFSYPFPVPTAPNQLNLGWPGRLQRDGDIPDQTFILSEGGLQVLRGEVDYDDVTAKEIGIILKSGYTEFTKKMDNKFLGEIDFGSEWWPPVIDTASTIYDKFEEWDIVNTTDNGKYVAAPFVIADANINAQDCSGATSKLKLVWEGGYYNYASLQFKVNFVVTTIFERAGYTVVENAIETSEFDKLVLFGKIINVFLYHIETGGLIVNSIFDEEVLLYSRLMPDIKVLDFLILIKDLLCMMYEIDEFKKEVRIKYKKDIFLPENLEAMQIKELAGWIHSEQKELKGFTLRYMDQDNELDTYTDWPEFIDVVGELPAATEENKIVVNGLGRYYMTVLNDSDVLEWQEVGRLREALEGEGENDVELKVIIPTQKEYLTDGINLECPTLLNVTLNRNSLYIPLTFLAITFYHGRKTFSAKSVPYASFDRYSIDGTVDSEISLKPSYLYSEVYTEFLNWQTYRARGFTKYIELSLVQLIALQWGKRYNIGGIEVILDKINYDLPYDGKVEVEGFTS